MAAQAGADIAIEIESSTPGTFLAFGGMRDATIRFNNQPIDITNADSSGLWTELLNAAGVKNMEVSGSFVFVDDTALERARARLFAGGNTNYKFTIPDYGVFAVAGQFRNLELSGRHDDAVMQSIDFVSSGAPTFTPA